MLPVVVRRQLKKGLGPKPMNNRIMKHADRNMSSMPFFVDDLLYVGSNTRSVISISLSSFLCCFLSWLLSSWILASRPDRPLREWRYDLSAEIGFLVSRWSPPLADELDSFGGGKDWCLLITLTWVDAAKYRILGPRRRIRYPQLDLSSQRQGQLLRVKAHKTGAVECARGGVEFDLTSRFAG